MMLVAPVQHIEAIGRPGRRMKIWAWPRDVAAAALNPATQATE